MDIQIELLGNFNIKVYHKMKECVEQIDPVDDINCFVKSSSTGQKRQEKWEFRRLDGAVSEKTPAPAINPLELERTMSLRRRPTLGKRAAQFVGKMFQSNSSTKQMEVSASTSSEIREEPEAQAQHAVTPSESREKPYTANIPSNLPGSSGTVRQSKTKTVPRSMEWMTKYAVDDDSSKTDGPADSSATSSPEKKQGFENVKFHSSKHSRVPSLSTLSSNEDTAADAVQDDFARPAPLSRAAETRATVAAEKSATMERSIERAVEKQVEKAEKQPIEKPIEKGAERGIEKPAFSLTVEQGPKTAPPRDIAELTSAVKEVALAPAPAPAPVPVSQPSLNKRVFSRRSIKMEGWLQVREDSAVEWIKRWCALEGGYIWFFECQEV